ncbi:uncharacterized protein LOC111319694 isoform X2 [Stylophora pistillata]|uniref:uncharacterized protein LOC111319694 isoform X2 n=1 Tax=Stylophora pistillata TaxID=50429 RepID=UPI000C04E7C4|nr:uncharacterized protein LOC111319694 isoform X2 [Stylophora pistillata]
MIIQRKIDALETVDKQLDFLMEVKYMTDVVNRIAILFNIAKIIEKDKEQKKVLKQEKSKAYIELLDSILEKLHRCLPQNLAVLMWSLGMNGEKHKKLLQLCEKKILSCGMSVFNNENIFQILNGCANLNMTKSPIFPKFEQAFLNGDVKISDLADHHLSGILYSFAIAGNGSVELFEALLEEFLSRDMTSMNSHPIAEFVWSFAKKEQEADELFDKVEAEVISRDMMDLNKTDFVKILWAFGKAEKGSKEFFQSLDHKIASLGVMHLCNAEILDIVWSFSKRHFSGAIFDVVKDELFQRGVQTLHTHELVLILLSFFSAQRHDDKLISEIEDVLCIRSVKHIASAQLCQLAWCLARTEKSDSGLFDSIEAVVSQRGISVFYKEEKLLLLQGFVEANKGSKKFYQLLCSSLLANKLSDFSERDIQQFAWCLSHVDIETGAIFDTLEKEIFNNEKYQFTEKQLISIKRSFEKVGKGTKELFEFEL